MQNLQDKGTIQAIEENSVNRLKSLVASLREVESTFEGRAALQSLFRCESEDN